MDGAESAMGDECGGIGYAVVMATTIGASVVDGLRAHYQHVRWMESGLTTACGIALVAIAVVGVRTVLPMSRGTDAYVKKSLELAAERGQGA